MVTAALLAALAAGVAIGPAPGPALVRVGPKQVRSRSASKIPRWAPLALVPIVVLPALLGIRTTLWLATAAVALGTVGWLVAGQRRRRRARLAAQECADGARILASLLRSGQIPTAALSEAAKECPQFQPAAAASALGADVSSVLRDRSTQPGCEGLGAVAAAWSVSERSGAPVAQVLARVAADLRRRLIGLFVVGPDGRSWIRNWPLHGPRDRSWLCCPSQRSGSASPPARIRWPSWWEACRANCCSWRECC